jgi:hypothetical protein
MDEDKHSASPACSSRLREDFGATLILFGTDVVVVRDAFERYIELCEAEIVQGRESFVTRRLIAERLLMQLNDDDPLMHDYKRPDRAEREKGIDDLEQSWRRHLEELPNFIEVRPRGKDK